MLKNGYDYLGINKKRIIFMGVVLLLGIMLSSIGVSAPDPPPGPPGGNP